MDDPSLPSATYADVLSDLAKVNATTMAYRPTLEFMRRAVRHKPAFSVLDVGFGNGDMLRRIAHEAVQRGQTARLTGVDLNPNSVRCAQAATPHGMAIDYVTGDYHDLAGQEWDCIISSLVAHHMDHAQLIAFLSFMDREARCGWFINDLLRHRFAYLAYPVLARIMRWHPIVQHDGRLSIARAYREHEWPPLLEEAGIRDARVFPAFPFRLCVEVLR